jgi:superfamily II DNA or RNA helicase
LIIQKQNESYTLLISENSSDIISLQKIHDFLKAEKPDAKYNFKVQRGWESPYTFFTEVKKIKDKNGTEQTIMKILNGHLQLLGNFGIDYKQESSEFSEQEVQEGLADIIKLMPFGPYDYQLKCASDCLLNPKQISLAATSSGKSCIIFMIIYFLYKKNKRGLVCVPSISLTTQIYGDFKDYFSKNYVEQRDEFLSCIELQGGGKESSFESFLTITTWQSLLNRKEHLDKAEFILCDEVQKYSGEEVSQIIKLTDNAKMKWGVTGTLPEDLLATMNLIGMFGKPKRYIRACELIERGLATPVEIISFIFKYPDEEKRIFNALPKGQFAKQLSYLKEHERRNKFITDLTVKIRDSGNTLLLGSHTLHLKEAFMNVMKRLHPDVEVQNKDITGKKSFDFQKKFGVYFLNGEDNAETRELTRKILEEKHYVLEFNDLTNRTLSENEFYKDVLVKNLFLDTSLYKEHNIKNITLRSEILISNFQLLSTGINIKRLFNLVMFSPLKSFTTITQSIGRGLRLHPDKKIFRVFDLIDDFGIRKPGGVFWKQYLERQRHSYNSEGYPITEKEYKL